MICRHRHQRWHLGPAMVDGVLTTGSKGTTWREMHQIGGLSADGVQCGFAWFVQAGNGAQQTDRVGMPRVAIDIARAALLNQSGIHDVDSICIARHHAQIMSDQHHRDATLTRQVLHELEDLRLNGDIQSSGRFVGQDECGTTCCSAMAIIIR